MNIPDIPAGTTKAEAALIYARAGIPVFPCGPDKNPLYDKVDLAHGFQNQTTNPKQIETWWKRWPDGNPASAFDTHTLVLDVDDTTKAKPVTDLLPKTGPAQLTGGARPGNQKHHRVYTINGYDGSNLITRIADLGIETKGLYKGYILLAPSVSTDGPYEWKRTGEPEPLPQSLYEVLTAVRAKPKPNGQAGPLITVTGGPCANWCDRTDPIQRDPGGYQYLNDFAFHRVAYHRDTNRFVLFDALLPLLDRMEPKYRGNEGLDNVNRVVNQMLRDVEAGKLGPDHGGPDPEPDDEFERQMARNAWTIRELLDLQIEHVPMIIDGILPKGRLGMIVAPYKAGKTSFCLQAGEALAQDNGSLLGLSVNGPLTVWVNEAEGSRESLQARQHAIHTALGKPAINPERLRLLYRQITLAHDPKAGLDRIRRMYDHFKQVPDVLFIGVLMRIADIRDENAASQMQPVMNALDAFAAEYDNLIVFTHHTGKAIRDGKGQRLGVGEFFDRARGSGTTLGSVDFAIGIDRQAHESDARINVLLRDGESRGFGAEFRFPLFVPPAGLGSILAMPEDRETKEIVKALLSGGSGMTVGEVATEVNGQFETRGERTVAADTVDRRLRVLLNNGVVTTSRGPRNVLIFRLAHSAVTSGDEVDSGLHPTLTTSAKSLAEVVPSTSANDPAEVPARVSIKVTD